MRVFRKPDTFPGKDVEFVSGPKYGYPAGGFRTVHGGGVNEPVSGAGQVGGQLNRRAEFR